MSEIDCWSPEVNSANKYSRATSASRRPKKKRSSRAWTDFRPAARAQNHKIDLICCDWIFVLSFDRSPKLTNDVNAVNSVPPLLWLFSKSELNQIDHVQSGNKNCRVRLTIIHTLVDSFHFSNQPTAPRNRRKERRDAILYSQTHQEHKSNGVSNSQNSRHTLKTIFCCAPGKACFSIEIPFWVLPSCTPVCRKFEHPLGNCEIHLF